jgi:hypothetical protein
VESICAFESLCFSQREMELGEFAYQNQEGVEVVYL